MKYVPLELKYQYGPDLVEEFCPPNCGGPPRLPDGRVRRKDWKSGVRTPPPPRTAGFGKPAKKVASAKPKHEWKEIKGTDSETIQRAALDIQKLLPGVVVSTDLVDRPRIDKNLLRQATVVHLNAIGSESARLRNEFPGLEKMLSNEGSMRKVVGHISIAPIMSRDRKSYRGAYGSWDRNGTKMCLSNTNYIKGSADKVTIGSYVAANSSGGTFRHELGHAIQDHLGIGFTKDRHGWISVMNSLPKNKAEQKKEAWFSPSSVKKRISEYAGTNHHEAFAEAFAAYTSAGYASSVKKLPKRVEQYFDHHLRNYSEKEQTTYSDYDNVIPMKELTMPYTEPPDKIKGLPPCAQEIWMAAFNSAWEQYEGDEAKATVTAWSAVKKQYEQDEGGKWVKKEAARIVGSDLSLMVSFNSKGNVWNDLPGWDSSQAVPPEWIRVLPLGTVVLNDSRAPFTVTDASLDDIMDKFDRNGVDMVVDYEHQTMTGDKAPAAGWVKELQRRAGGLWAYVQWTDTAKDFIKNKEYRYYSPTVRLDSSRNVVGLLHIGLTNFPAISGISPLTLKKDPHIGGDMNFIEMLRNVLGLGEGANESDIILMVRDLTDVRKSHDGFRQAELSLSKVSVPVTVTESLNLKRDSSITDIVTRIEGLKMAADRAKELDAQIASLKGDQIKSVADALIEEALSTGRTSPAELEKQDGKLRRMAETDPEFFKEFVLGRQPGSIVPLERLPNTKINANTQSVPAEVQTLLDRAGLTMEQFRQQQERERQGKTLLGF